MSKVLKVSQQFKSSQGAIDYANIRSIIDTSRKKGLNEFESLSTVIDGNSLFQMAEQLQNYSNLEQIVA